MNHRNHEIREHGNSFVFFPPTLLRGSKQERLHIGDTLGPPVAKDLPKNRCSVDNL